MQTIKFIGQLILVMLFVVMLWAMTWLGCAMNDKCYYENMAHTNIYQVLGITKEKK
tara:strand:+ start:248 stop:415 length:168 start_codon:yes stop_codon:yes gene_type:complete